MILHHTPFPAVDHTSTFCFLLVFYFWKKCIIFSCRSLVLMIAVNGTGVGSVAEKVDVSAPLSYI